MYRLPSELKIYDFWPMILEYRKKHGKEITLKDQQGNNFWYCSLPYMDKMAMIDNSAKFHVVERIKTIFKKSPKIAKDYLVDALIDEAFNSSVIEGAFSTKKRTVELVSKKIKPVNNSEQMILNNYKALEYVLENLHRTIDENIILEIYRIITYNTLKEDDVVKKYRNDSVVIWDSGTQKVIYEGPNYIEVPKMMRDLVEFINTDQDMHPIEKASIIHFYFVYVHPFFDGNGRTSRALQYMYLLQQGYDFFKFFSISTIIRDQKMKYYKSIQNVEEYNSDLTYFINFNTSMIINSIVAVIDRLGKELGKHFIISELENNGVFLSERVKKCLFFFIRTEKDYISIDDYKKKHKVSYETARQDLNKLESAGIFKKVKIGKKYIFKFIGLKGLGLGEFSSAKD
ncbi:hypothetical protein Desgi_2415 [Desulfoscipio gibsoniae DSM 7213]|uniref:Fido domain-containing protein n=2 Tax=Desulfoscipio gibsoniae TaxID=102134 RepID=R4KF65_9FIRM|nr:hypothetical protein Desgi_2415 [Desulfoscipio gibsoniae DSM 7213]